MVMGGGKPGRLSFSLPHSGCCSSEQQYYFHRSGLGSFGISTSSQVGLQMNGSSCYSDYWDSQGRLCGKSGT